MDAFEKLGVFYLGKEYDLSSQTLSETPVLYDSKDLTTHAVIIGMTGSGKTGLGISLIEEALIDSIPVIAIDPKGDLPNLLLHFPELRPKDFRPWINEQDALKKALSAEAYAAHEAETWKKGLASWGQGPERIERLKASAVFDVYTPGSSAGMPVSVLRAFDPPRETVRRDADLFRERLQTTTTSLLALLGVDADPLTSREHIFISNLLARAWAEGRTLDLAAMIREVQRPPFERIGVMDLETFYPPGDRLALAMRMNALLAAPGFGSWLEGEPLDAGRFFYAPNGRPKASIFTLAHLPESDRMFFVSVLLNEILGWMRSQQGTASLRALLYMDEIFGYFPPVKTPPSKGPLLTLLKQARAYGLGVVLSTQNPVDLDYKGLSNTGTWFIGRLQTERDKQRVIEGLEGAAAGGGFDRARMEEVLAGLGKRVFLLHNVHENEHAVFQTRWALSYLAGPMTREQIRLLMAERKTEADSAAGPTPLSADKKGTEEPPPGPSGVETYYLRPAAPVQQLVFHPAVIARTEVYYSDRRLGVDTKEKACLAWPIEEGPVPVDWEQTIEIAGDPAHLETRSMTGVEFADLPAAARRPDAFAGWEKDLLRWIRQNRPMRLFRSRRFNQTSRPGETESAFRARLGQALREHRDLQVARLQSKHGAKFATLRDRLMRAEQAIAREADQAKAKKLETGISFGTAILGAFLGRKAVSAASATRFGTAMKSASRVKKEQMDVDRARERAEAVRAELTALEARLQEEIQGLEESLDPSTESLEQLHINPKGTDMVLTLFGLAWLPYRKDDQGRLLPAW